MGPLSSRRRLDPFTRSTAQRVREDVERLTPAAPSLPMMVVSRSQASRAMTTHQALEEKKSINPPNRCQARDRRKVKKREESGANLITSPVTPCRPNFKHYSMIYILRIQGTVKIERKDRQAFLHSNASSWPGQRWICYFRP
ncbi:hypothetical protein FOCG_16375 [Fusarium oxysporum f. sp. radicis-lycopersici 26381]|uniref:Uncharacterized protein n=1 Tax=Fusarium oxysporum Fo47 TaxID=660027 RepID=W9L2D2_FUSOX|nr:hypothetical protein FOZG_03358 [Fusarium oxysporum Fo47]EXL40986.1 hypothetical protein FOCG_16375 [Fusarium oxysporum f. sp. radicis-lycopersici 26381]